MLLELFCEVSSQLGMMIDVTVRLDCVQMLFLREIFS